MLLQLLLILAVAMAAVVASNFCLSFAPFYSDHGYALVDHVIKTLPLFKPDCMSVCQETLTCFSINIYQHQNGSLMCDLNRSNKKQRPRSFVLKTGYEYAEPKNMTYCVKGDCTLKDALRENKFKFNSSIFEFFAGRTNWSDARQHCRGLGGDLASFSSKTELMFVFETTLLSQSFLLLAMKSLLTDKGLSLVRSAKLESQDNRPSLFLTPTSYATTPRFDFHQTDLTIAVWVKLKSLSGYQIFILNDEGGSGRSFSMYLFDQGKLKVEWFYSSGSSFIQVEGNLSLNVWTHIAFTWHRQSGRAVLYLDGGKSAEKQTYQINKDLKLTQESVFYIGRRNGFSAIFDGWMSDLVMIFQTLSEHEIDQLQDGKASEGAWIGLNDITTERQIQWSDGTLLTYQYALSNTEDKDCGYINGNRTASASYCSRKLPFFCELPAV